MKRKITAILALLMALALTTCALADTKYAKKDNVKVYEYADDDSEVLTRLDMGDKVDVTGVDGKWSLVSVGSVEGWVKSKYLVDDEPCDHEWGKWKVEREATCTRKGLRVRECELCGEEEEEEIRKADHDYGKWTVEREPTCTREGRRVRTCRECGYEDEEAIEKEPHDFGSWEVTVEATDHSAGVRSRTCRICGEEETYDYDPEGTLRRGDRGDDVRALQEQLIEQGYMKGRADGSYGASTETAVKKLQQEMNLEADGVAWPQTQKRLQHTYGPWEIVTPVTREADGERVRTCSDCGREERETLVAAPAFERRARGEGVRFVQTMLNALGYNAGSADGSYGGKLDSAFAAFAEAQGIAFVPQKVTPADIDALTNQWIASLTDEQWKGRADGADYDLLLSVKPLDEEEGAIRTYEWTLENLGAERCRFNALLLGFTADHDFRSGNIVLAVDNAQLKANDANTLTGTVAVSLDWGGLVMDSLSFTALVTSEKGDEVWLSNTMRFAIEE